MSQTSRCPACSLLAPHAVCRMHADELRAQLAEAQRQADKYEALWRDTEILRQGAHAKLDNAIRIFKKIDCECGGEEPDGSSPTCYRCLALDEATRGQKLPDTYTSTAALVSAARAWAEVGDRMKFASPQFNALRDALKAFPENDVIEAGYYSQIGNGPIEKVVTYRKQSPEKVPPVFDHDGACSKDQMCNDCEKKFGAESSDG